MSMAITMEPNAVDTAIESAAAVASSLHRVVLEMHDSAKSCIATQQLMVAIRKSVAERLSQQLQRLKNIESDTAGIEKKLKNATAIKIKDIGQEVGIKVSAENLMQGVLDLERDYRDFKLLLRTHKVVSTTSFSILLVMGRIFKSLNKTKRNARYIHRVISRINNYSSQEYAVYRASQLAGNATLNSEVLKLSEDEILFILDAQERPARTHTLSMQHALQHYAQCSVA